MKQFIYFLSNKRCIRMCHNIKNNSHEFVFLRAGSKSVNNILYYTLIYRKIRTLHIEVHLGFLSHRREIRTLHTKNPREFFAIHGVELEFAYQKF